MHKGNHPEILPISMQSTKASGSQCKSSNRVSTAGRCVQVIGFTLILAGISLVSLAVYAHLYAYYWRYHIAFGLLAGIIAAISGVSAIQTGSKLYDSNLLVCYLVIAMFSCFSASGLLAITYLISAGFMVTTSSLSILSERPHSGTIDLKGNLYNTVENSLGVVIIILQFVGIFVTVLNREEQTLHPSSNIEAAKRRTRFQHDASFRSCCKQCCGQQQGYAPQNNQLENSGSETSFSTDRSDNRNPSENSTNYETLRPATLYKTSKNPILGSVIPRITTVSKSWNKNSWNRSSWNRLNAYFYEPKNSEKPRL